MLPESAELAALRVEVKHLADTVADLRAEVRALRDQANRWKGAFIVILALGGALSWLAQLGFERAFR
jgi:hypothetical protein